MFTNIRKAIDSLKAYGGFSYNINTGELNPSEGYMVAVSKETEERAAGYFKMPHELIEDFVRAYGIRHADLLADHDHYLGAWIKDDVLYLDIAELIEDKNVALVIAKDRDQVAIFDNANGADINVK